MFCPNCGSKNEDNAATCVSCGRPLPRTCETPPPPALPRSVSSYPPPQSVTVPNYLVPAILVTIFCCWIFGIPAIIYAAQSNTKAAQGDYYGARAASSTALIWCWVSAGASALGLILYFILIGFLGVMAGGPWQ